MTDFRLTETVDMENMFEKNPVAEGGNIFVELTIKVKNNGTKSDSFHPSNLVKLIVHGATIDAANVLTDRLSDQIEPFTSQIRKFYFEIPQEFEGESAELQFAEGHLFSQETPFTVTITLPKQEQSTAVAAPTPTPQPTPQARTLAATPAPEETPPSANDQQTENTAQANFVMRINRALDNHDWRTLTEMTVSGLVNYFGHRHVTNTFIAQDMANDSRNYLWVHSTLYPNTFTHEVSDQYSSYWSGPMLYDSINVYSEAQEKNGRLHKALSRLTVGYVLGPSRHPAIYSLTLKVL